MANCLSRDTTGAPPPEPQSNHTPRENSTPRLPQALRFQAADIMVEQYVRQMVDLYSNVNQSLDERPVCLVYLQNIAFDEVGWHDMINALISSVSLRKPLAATVIIMVFEECPLPTVSLVVSTIRSFQLCRTLASSCLNNEEFKRRERNRLVVLGCMADKFSGPISSKMLQQDTMEYLYGFLTHNRSPLLLVHAIVTMEKFAKSKESMVSLSTFFAEQEAENPLIPLENHHDSPHLKWQQVGFCARWFLDNIFLEAERPLSYTTVDMSLTNAVLDFRRSTDSLKVSPEGLTARCDTNSFEFVRGTFKIESGCWYYEAHIITAGVMQIGWAGENAQFCTQATDEEEDNFSLSYDGCRRVLRLKTMPTLYEDMEVWRQGDILGCFIDVEKKEALFAVNGVRLPLCKDIFRSNRTLSCEDPTPNVVIYAAASLMCFQSVRFNFGLEEFYFAPVDKEFKTFNDNGVLTMEQKQIVPRWMHLESVRALQAANTVNDDDLCNICYFNTTETIAMPCHHMSFCYKCAARLTKCPVCREDITMEMPEDF